jgi:3-hydroxyacyl-CoA dehydrogenase
MLLKAIVEAYKHDMSPEEADAILGRPVGFEKSGVFGTLDVVGLDIMPHIMKSLSETLPKNDPFHDVYKEAVDLGLLDTLEKMIADGYTGRKGKGGFYRPKKDDKGKTMKDAKGKTILESMNLKTGEYGEAQKVSFKSAENGKKGLKAALQTNDKGGKYAWDVLNATLLYTAGRIPEISDDISSVDLAMRSGFKWKKGPFEMIEDYGLYDFVNDCTEELEKVPSWLSKAALGGENLYKKDNGRLQERLPSGEYKNVPRPEGVVTLSDHKAGNKPLIKGNSASAWDIGDGVVCLEFHSKMNSIDPSILLTINQTIDLINGSKGKYKALVIHNEAENFSAGANLGFATMMYKAGLYKVIEDMIYYGQSTYNALRYAPFPVVGAPRGMALGGGCEILMHCDAIQAGAETYTGLVEVGVGVIPGWNGCARLLERVRDDKRTMGGPMPTARRAFEMAMLPQFSMSTSGPDAQKKLWLRPSDEISMNSDRLLADAKAKALKLSKNYEPPKPSTFSLPGQPGKAAIASAIEEMAAQNKEGSPTNITKHDARVAHALADVMSGGDAANHTDILTEDDIAYLERRNFMELIHTKETQKRIEYMVAKGKPLREKDMASTDEMREVRSLKRKFDVANKPLKREPLKGWDAVKLKAMAGMTWGMYKVLIK